MSNRNLTALIHLVELRSTSAVLPTLQRRGLQMGHTLSCLLSDYEFKLYCDEQPFERFDPNRGKQDIA